MKVLMLTSFMFFGLMQNSYAGVEVHEFSNPEHEKIFVKLVNELRCLVCQNQNLADSNAELAQDLRKEVFQMIQKGQTSDEIVEFMVARYGDFVLYRPPFKPETLILWIGPFAILLLAIVFVVVFIRKKKQAEHIDMSDDDKKYAESLLSSLSDEKDDK